MSGRMLAELSDEQRRVLELSFYEEKPHVEIALLLKIPLGTVKLAVAPGDEQTSQSVERVFMTIEHHLVDALLIGFAAGTLDLGQHVLRSLHPSRSWCSACRDMMHLMEHAGGALLEDLPPTPMSSGALARIEARLQQQVASGPGVVRVEPLAQP